MRDSFIGTVTEKAARDKRIYLLTGDLGFSVFEAFARRFNNRFVNVGVAEANMIGVAAGLALSGKIPVVYSIIPFTVGRCLDQIKMDVCFQRSNVKIVGVGAGVGYGYLGVTHHAIEDIALMRGYPNIRILSPCDPAETKACCDLALRTAGPFYIRLGKSREARIHSRAVTARCGGSIRICGGKDATILTTGSITGRVLEAKKLLSRQGIDAGVVSLYSLKPLDTGRIKKALKQTGCIVTVEEHTVMGGLGSAVGEVVAGTTRKNTRLLRIGINDTFCDAVGTQSFLLDKYGLSPKGIAKKIAAFTRA